MELENKTNPNDKSQIITSNGEYEIYTNEIMDNEINSENNRVIIIGFSSSINDNITFN